MSEGIFFLKEEVSDDSFVTASLLVFGGVGKWKLVRSPGVWVWFGLAGPCSIRLT